MFSQKKSFFRGKAFLFVIAGLMIFGYWINKGPAEDQGTKQSDPKSTLTAQQEENNRKSKDSAKQAVNPQPTQGYRTPTAGGITDSIDVEDPDSQDADQDLNDTNSNAADSVDQDVDQERPEGIDSIDGPYYLIREDNGAIKVYYCEEGKKARLIRTTDITFSLLSESDQKLFERGIVKQTEDQLSELLQDFES